MRQIANLLRGFSTPPRVRIPPSPPENHTPHLPVRGFFIRPLPGGLPLLLLLGVWALCPACVERKLFLRTDPPEVSLNLDGRELGLSPVVVPFTHYGIRRVELRKPGYRVKTVYIHVTMPWYQYFPLDLFSDLFWPATIRDDQVFFFSLEPRGPAAPPDRTEILKRAEALRLEEVEGSGPP